MFNWLRSKRDQILLRPLSFITQSLEQEPVTCLEETTLLDAIEMMNTYYVGSILVKNKSEKIVGIFTERDLLYKVTPNRQIDLATTTIAEYMTPGADALKSSETIDVAIGIMRSRNHRHLVILNEQGKLDRVISIKDLLFYLDDEISRL